MRYLFSILLVSLSLCSFGQRGKDILLSVDTVRGSNTVYVNFPKTSGTYQTFTTTTYFTEVGGTTDGIMTLEGGMVSEVTGDTLWVTLTADNDLVNAEPNDTVTIVDGLVAAYVIIGTPFNEHRLKIVGTVGDTTRQETSYNKK